MPFDPQPNQIRYQRIQHSIDELKAEKEKFLRQVPKSITSSEADAIAVYNNRPVPSVFGVLVSEIGHHLRSCLDNFAWHVSHPQTEPEERRIMFPIREIDNGFASYLLGAPQHVVDAVRALQPFTDAQRQPNKTLLILHDLNRYDKHRTLVSTASRTGLVQEITPGPSGALATSPPFWVPRITFLRFGNSTHTELIIGVEKLQHEVVSTLFQLQAIL